MAFAFTFWPISPVLLRNRPVPVKFAWMSLIPGVSMPATWMALLPTLKVATPPPLTATGLVFSFKPLAKKSTLPVGVLLLETVAVKVMVAPTAGLTALEVRAVVVGLALTVSVLP